MGEQEKIEYKPMKLNKEQEEAKAIVDMTDEEISKMSFKEKQKHFRNRNKLCKVVYCHPYNIPFRKEKNI